MAQLKFLIVLLAALYIAKAVKISPCRPGYVQKEDCVLDAIDPAQGNCYWAADFNSCEIYAKTEDLCAINCRDCINCLYMFGCCIEGEIEKIQSCRAHCVANMQYA